MAYVFISAFSRVISAVVAPDKVSIDNWSFKLYYRMTPMILGVSTVLVCCRRVQQTNSSSPANSSLYKVSKICLCLVCGLVMNHLMAASRLGQSFVKMFAFQRGN